MKTSPAAATASTKSAFSGEEPVTRVHRLGAGSPGRRR